MKKAISLIICILLMLSTIPSISATTQIADSNENIVLFEGNANAEFTTWQDWQTAVSISVNKGLSAILSDGEFYIDVDYISDQPPILVFMSWTGGNSWAQMKPDYYGRGSAYYSYKTIDTENNLITDDDGNQTYSNTFSLVNSIRLKPYESDLTITKVTLHKGRPDTSIKLNGKAGKIADSIKIGWNLGDTLECYYKTSDGTNSALSREELLQKLTSKGLDEQQIISEFETYWHNPMTTKQIFATLKSQGFNAVRVPVTWSQHMDENGSIDSAWMSRVKEVVGYVLDSNMYCILNVHHDTGKDKWLNTSADYDTTSTRFCKLWKQIAENFLDYDDRLLFEGFNEILDGENHWSYQGNGEMDVVNKLNKVFVDTVRSTGNNNSDRCLIINTYAASANHAILDKLQLPEDNGNIIVEIHSYQPGNFCAKEDSKAENEPFEFSEFKDEYKQTIDNIFSTLWYSFTRNGIPVIIGEFGSVNKDNEIQRARHAEYYVTKAKQYGIKCFWWDDGGMTSGYGLLDRENYSFKYPTLAESLAKAGIITGDVNDDYSVDISDVTEIQRYLAELNSLSTLSQLSGDTNHDNITDIRDVSHLQKCLANIETLAR